MSPPPAESTDTRPPQWWRTRRVSRFALWGVLLVLATAGGIIGSAWVTSGTAVGPVPLVVTGLGTTAAAVLAWLLLATTPTTAIKLSPQMGKRLVLGSAFLLSASAVVLVEPVLLADPLRARSDGDAWLSGLSPYRWTALEVADRQRAGESSMSDQDPHARAAVLLSAGVPDADAVSARPPGAQVASLATRAIEYVLPRGAGRETTPAMATWREALSALPWWRQLTVHRVLLSIAFLLTVGELIAWLRQAGRSVWWSTLFAWPAATWLWSGGFAMESMGAALFLVGGLRRLEAGRRRRSGLCLAAAVAFAPLLAILLPFVARRHGRLTTTWFVGAVVLMYLPILLAQGGWRGYGGAVWADAFDSSGGLAHFVVAGVQVPPETQGWVTLVLVAVLTLVVMSIAWRRGAGLTIVAYAFGLASAVLTGRTGGVVWLLAIAPFAMPGRGLSALMLAGTTTPGLPLRPGLALTAGSALVEWLVGRRRQRRRPGGDRGSSSVPSKPSVG
jgi:hypothetical protein